MDGQDGGMPLHSNEGHMVDSNLEVETGGGRREACDTPRGPPARAKAGVGLDWGQTAQMLPKRKSFKSFGGESSADA